MSPNCNILHAACFVILFFGSASAQNLPAPDSRAIVREGLVLTLEDYRMDAALLLESALARDSSRITLFDYELIPILEDLQSYVNRTKERYGFAREKGLGDLRMERTAAQVYAYAGIAYGRMRRFPEAHALLDSARALHPGVGKEPYPLPWAQMDTLGTLMEEQADKWYRRLGRIRVVANPQWTADSLRFTPLQIEAKIDSTKAYVPQDLLVRTMYDSVRALSAVVLRDSIRASVPEFDIYLPRGSYNLKDAQEFLVPVKMSVGDSLKIAVDPRVDLWVPEGDMEADFIKFKEIMDGVSGDEVDARHVAFGKEYELIVGESYQTRQDRIFFYRPGFPRLDKKGVTAIQADPGKPCLYFKEGAGKLRKRFFIKRYLKYILLPTIFVLATM